MNKILIITVLVLSFIFYWFELRPIPIRQSCEAVARIAIRDKTASNYKDAYVGCLHTYGLKE